MKEYIIQEHPMFPYDPEDHPQELIRCKDCQNRHIEEKCPLVHPKHGQIPFSITIDFALDNDYCSRAERKGEQE